MNIAEKAVRDAPRPRGRTGYWRADCWTPEEDRIAETMRAEGFTPRQIARRLNRSTAAVYYRFARCLNAPRGRLRGMAG